MRIDKFLKTSRVIKRRTVAAEACAAGRVSINGRVAKPSAEVKPGDIVEIRFGERKITLRAEQIRTHALKEDAPLMYTVLENN